MAKHKRSITEPTLQYDQKYHLIDNEVYERQTFHTFRMGDVDEFDLYANYAVNTWLDDTEKGQWVRAHVKDLKMQSYADHTNFGHSIFITGMISSRHWTYFVLKYKHTDT